MNTTTTFVPDYVMQINASDKEMIILFEKVAKLGEILKIITPLIFIILFLIGTIGNILVAYVTLSPSSTRFTTSPIHSILVLNLAAADVIYLLCNLPYQAITYSVPGWIYGATMCPLLHFMSVWTMAVGIFTMCSLAIMRYIGLALPFRFQNSFLHAAGQMARLAMVIVLWFFGALLAIPNLIHFQINPEPPEVCDWPDRSSHNAYWIVLVTCTYVIPFILVATLYILIAVQVICFMKSKDARPTYEHTDQRGYKKLKTMVMSLISAFLICWFPYHLYVIIQVSGHYSDHKYTIVKTILELLGYCFSYMHACINPIIYTFAAPEFRRSLCTSLRRHSFTETGPCSWKRSSFREGSPNLETPHTKITYTHNDQWPKMTTSVHLEMSSNLLTHSTEKL